MARPTSSPWRLRTSTWGIGWATRKKRLPRMYSGTPTRGRGERLRRPRNRPPRSPPRPLRRRHRLAREPAIQPCSARRGCAPERGSLDRRRLRPVRRGSPRQEHRRRRTPRPLRPPNPRLSQVPRRRPGRASSPACFNAVGLPYRRRRSLPRSRRSQPEPRRRPGHPQPLRRPDPHLSPTARRHRSRASSPACSSAAGLL
jgi:hypothetical protein